MKEIWKWAIVVNDRSALRMPKGAQLLCVQWQGDLVMLWAVVETSAPKVTRRIAVYGTGQPLPDNPGTYVDTFQMMGGKLVWHVFDLGEE